MFRINGVIKHYNWGGDLKRIAIQGNHHYNENETKFAELWLGTHNSGRFTINYEETKKDLPYLLKMLSIKKVLSIQVHPNKEQAIELHNKFPKIYTDPNPKPEIAIPLTDFEALAGLLSYSEVQENLKNYPELAQYDTLEKLLTSGIKSNSIPIRFTNKLDQLIIRLKKQYPDDIGIFCPLYIRYHQLNVGEAMYIPPGCPHAYISGEIIEAMVCSDNVVRVALTEKFKDHDTLFKIMTTEQPVLYKNEKKYTVDNTFSIEMIDYKSNTELHIEDNSILLDYNIGEAYFIEKKYTTKFNEDKSFVLITTINEK
jgi:mannose-6-phosphate isomerase